MLFQPPQQHPLLPFLSLAIIGHLSPAQHDFPAAILPSFDVIIGHLSPEQQATCASIAVRSFRIVPRGFHCRMPILSPRRRSVCDADHPPVIGRIASGKYPSNAVAAVGGACSTLERQRKPST